MFTSARRHACPCKHSRDGRPLIAVIPDGSGLTPACLACGAPMVPSGELLAGEWRVDECCTPASPDGKWAGPPRDPRKCTSCFGTQRRAVCTLCWVTGCDGVHDFCIPCLGEKIASCRDCEGEGRIFAGDDDETGVRCDQCRGIGQVKCPACGGTGRPAERGQQAGQAAGHAALTGETTNYDATNTTYDAFGGQVAPVIDAADQMVAGLQSRGVDAETITDATGVAELAGKIAAAVTAAKKSHIDRHQGLSQAHKTAPGRAADREYYEGG